MNKLNNESSNNKTVSTGCNIEKAVDIINKADDVNIDLTEYTELHEEEEKPINPEVLINAVVDIKNAMVDRTINATNDNNNNAVNSADSDNNKLINTADINNKNNTTDDVNNNKSISGSGNSKLSVEQLEKARATGRQGGLQNGINHKKRRTAKDILGELLERQLMRESVDEILGESAQILGEDKTVYAVMCAKMIQIACAGDIKAFIAIRDTVGDKPADEHLISADVMTDADRRMVENLKRRMDKQALSLHND
jgi:hypothetical protein